MTYRWLAIALGFMAVYVACFSAYVVTTLPRIGYIDSNVLMSRHDEAISARRSIEKTVSDWRDKVRTLESELQDLNREIVQGGPAEKTKQAEARAELARRQEELVRYAKAVSENAAELERETMRPVFDALNVAIADFSRERGYDLIFGTAVGGNVLSAAPQYDLTEEFLAFLAERDAAK